MKKLVEDLKEEQHTFEIHIADKIHYFEYRFDDPIFTISDANKEIKSDQNPYCNCCKENYKSYKEAKYC